MQGKSPQARFRSALALAFSLAFLASCERTVGTWGKNALSRGEFETFLEDRGDAYRANAGYSQAAMSSAAHHALSNRARAAEARLLGFDRNLAANPGFTNALLRAIGIHLDRSWSPSDRQITVDLVKRHATTWDAEAFYILGRCDSNHVPDGPTARLIAHYEPRIRAASNLEKLWGELRKDGKVGYTRLTIGWTTVYWRFVPLAEGTAPGATSAPVFQDTGVMFLRFGPPRIPAANELNQAMKRDDFRQAMRDAVRTRRVQEFKAQCEKEGRSETVAMLGWKGDEAFRKSMVRFTNDYLAEQLLELAAARQGTFSKSDGEELLSRLFNQYPLQVFPNALPASFTQEKRKPSTAPPPAGAAWRRLLDRVRHPSAPARWEAGEKELGEAVSLRQGAARLEGPSREALEKKVIRHCATADRLFQGSFGAGLASHDRAWKAALSFLKASDFPRSRAWMIRSLSASGLRRDEIRGQLLRGTDATQRLLLTEAVGASGDDSWIPMLGDLLALEGVAGDLQCFALEALGRLPNRGQAALIEKYYRDPSKIWGVRFMASQSLEKLTGRKYPVENPGEPAGGVKHP
jgi:hypothetical protein